MHNSKHVEAAPPQGAPDIPRVPGIVVDAIAELLLRETATRKKPVMAATLLGLICELHRLGRPFPKRDEVARSTGMSLASVDAGLSTRIDEGFISARIETRTGFVERRRSVVRDRYYDPSPVLLAVYEKARALHEEIRTANARTDSKRRLLDSQRLKHTPDENEQPKVFKPDHET